MNDAAVRGALSVFACSQRARSRYRLLFGTPLRDALIEVQGKPWVGRVIRYRRRREVGVWMDSSHLGLLAQTIRAKVVETAGPLFPAKV